MPRRNLNLLLLIGFISFICYQQAESAHRSRYGRMFETFTEVLGVIERTYLEPTDDRELFQGALQGMVEQLDSYSAYIPPRQAQEFKEDLEGEFGGIGIEVTWDRETRTLTVMSPLVGTPAYEAGVLAGDTIVGIDGHSTEEFTLEDAVRHLRGKPGSTVRLMVLHEGDEEPVEINITRAIIHVDTVLGDLRTPDGWEFFLEQDSRIGYIRVTTFGEHTVAELNAALARLRAGGMQGLILDLRNNAGGLLTEGIAVCDMFIKEGRIVSTRGRNGMLITSADASGQAQYTDFPMAVLVNRFSASASEIVAACLQDHERAVIVGQRTWGKGTVQNVTKVDDGTSLLKLTVASYWRPSGENIHRSEDDDENDKWGVTPNEGFQIELTEEQLVAVIRQRRLRDVLQTSSSDAAAKETPGEAALPDEKASPAGEEGAPDDATTDDATTDEAPTAQAGDAEHVDPQLQRALEYLQQRLSETQQASRAA